MKPSNFLIVPKGILAGAAYITASCLLPAVYSLAQTPGEWTWMHGDSAPNSPGIYGTKGVANPANTPPGLYEPCEWTDKNGNFWLYGGGTSVSTCAALWKYDPATNEWTWMNGPSSPTYNPAVYGTQGVPSLANNPGSRAYGVLSWTDAPGNLWLFGGLGGGFYNDLWKYTIASNQWTWMKGPKTLNDSGSYGTKGIPSPINLPPSRYETSCSWTDNTGNLWLYGGMDKNGRYGDLWKYDISTNEWTWIHGANTPNPLAVFGTQGVADPANTPGGRNVYCSWTDLAGNLWLFGGAYTTGYINDLWKYDIASNQWTWMKGPNTVNAPGNYGTKCISATTNMPPPRNENRARIRDTCGNFWNCGGQYRNDLWYYNVSANQWTWVSGDNTPGQAAIYGVKGLSAPANKPGERNGSVAWIDNKGNIWVFGGLSKGTKRDNALFRFVPDTNCIHACSAALSAISASTNIPCGGQCTGTGTVTPSGGTGPYAYSWNSAPPQTTRTVTGLCAGTYSVLITDATGTTATGTINITQATAPVAGAASSASVIASGGSVTLSASGGGAYSWSPLTGLSCITCANPIASPDSTTIYCVTVTDTNGCSDSACVIIRVDIPCSGIYLPNAFSPNGDGENDVLQIYFENILCITQFHLVIYNRWGENMFETTDPKDKWDGRYGNKTQNSAVFIYYMEATLTNGETINKKGNISLIR